MAQLPTFLNFSEDSHSTFWESSKIFRNILAAMHMGNECLNISTLIVFTNIFMCHPKYAMHTTYLSITSGMHYIFWIAHFFPDFIR